jgi:hypothetical protein
MDNNVASTGHDDVAAMNFSNIVVGQEGWPSTLEALLDDDVLFCVLACF